MFYCEKVQSIKKYSFEDKSWREKAEKELGETSDAYEKVKQIRTLLADSGESYKGRDDEAFILRFLRAKKFDVDKAFKMVRFKVSWYLKHL